MKGFCRKGKSKNLTCSRHEYTLVDTDYNDYNDYRDSDLDGGLTVRV